MRWFRFAVFILIVTFLQAGLLDIIAVTDFRIKPDLLLILMVFFATYCNSTGAVIASFATGFAADIIGPAMGPQIISFGLFGWLLANINRVIAIRRMPYQAATIFICCFLTGILAYFLGLLKGQPALPNIYVVLFGTSLYSSLVGPLLFEPSAWLMRLTPRFSRYRL